MQLDYKRIDFDTKWILNGSKSIIYRESINSTLSIALDKEHQINDKGKVVITDNQTSGKGTHGKQWISTPYKDLTFSIILGSNNNFGQKLINECCLVMVHVLSLYGMKASIKSPNDIYINNKKIVGILLSNIQSRGLENKTYQALSIGMNVNSAIDIKAIDVGAKVSSTSVLLELGNEVNREDLLKLIIENIDPAIQKQEYL